MSSTEEAPESYLAILPSLSEQYYDDIFLNFKINSDKRQTLGLLDALAEYACRRQRGRPTHRQWRLVPKRARFSSLEITKRVPQVTQDYLNDVCRQLTDVAHLADATGLPKPSISRSLSKGSRIH